ncbi:MAG: DUF87 domain-containing protein [Spartobacteria bacterium]|nr:DUF87 domain-containing protein [Spartobacteria bacterium]
MQDYEKLGAFYLGKETDKPQGAETLMMYDAKDLTTHAVILGMTGSGKTGLGISILEEAAIDCIPAIVIDPKGDIGNLLLSFPELRPDDFRPWIDEAAGRRKNMNPDEYAQSVASMWKKGLKDWHQEPSRIQLLKNAAEMTIYTPGNSGGRPIQVLRSFNAPPPQQMADSGLVRDRVLSAVSGLMALLGMEADPIQSREHILLSNILMHAWNEGRDMDLAGLIMAVQKPPFTKIGILELESFYPAKDRFSLAMSLNNLLASPGFSAWLEGDPLDIQRMLYTPEGKPRISILSIAHLSDKERMFFVTVVLNEMLTWVRNQSGTSSLRALLYMDEIFGYFPPTANPPSKQPMLMLLKQARAFGLGVVLSTQNPSDLDYKGLSNAGTWFIGRLQTERDRSKVIEGLQGAMNASGGSFDKPELEALLSGLGSRVFLMRNVHEEHPVRFQCRWALSYLCGPLTISQIRTLCVSPTASSSLPPATSVATMNTAHKTVPARSAASLRPDIPDSIEQFFMRPDNPNDAITYTAHVVGFSKLHFVDRKSDIDEWQGFSHVARISDNGKDVFWSEADQYSASLRRKVDREGLSDASFVEPPHIMTKSRPYTSWKARLKEYLYQNTVINIYSCPQLKMTSGADESEGDFTVRVQQVLREKRDEAVDDLRKRYASKVQTMENQLQRAKENEERQRSQATTQSMDTAISFGASILGAFFGRKVTRGTVSKMATSIKSATKTGREQGDVRRASETIARIQQQLNDLQHEIDDAIQQIHSDFEHADIEQDIIRPRKTDITVSTCGLLWIPART